MNTEEVAREVLFGESQHDFHWFLAGPIAIPCRVSNRIVDEEYSWCADDEVGLLWRAVVQREFAKREMGVVDPYSSKTEMLLDLFGEKDGYKVALSVCNGVVACLFPYHWEHIPRREAHLSIALDFFKVPFVAFSPDVELSERECSTMKEVKRFMSIIPTCTRIRNAMKNAHRKGIVMPTTTKDLHVEVPTVVMVTCNVCGCAYRSELIIEAGSKRAKDSCPKCSQQLITE